MSDENIRYSGTGCCVCYIHYLLTNDVTYYLKSLIMATLMAGCRDAMALLDLITFRAFSSGKNSFKK